MSLAALFPTLSAPLVLADGGTLDPAEDFEVLGLALNAAGLTSTVASLQDVTVFAPSDQAFANLATELGFTGDTEDADAVFGSIASSLSGLAPDGDPIPLLTDILLYHVSPGAETLEDLNADGPVDTLLDGEQVILTGGTVVDGDTDALNADVISADNDTGASTVQVVDQVLLPIDTPVESGPGTLLDVLKESGGTPDNETGDFDLLLTALQATGLDEAADTPGADLTVFAPTDAAFISLAQDLGYEGEDEAGALQTILSASQAADPENPLGLVRDILEYHISPGAQDAEAVLSSSEIETLEGPTITVDGTSLIDQDPDAATADIIATDIEASNGIAHAIDEVLLPIDIPMADGVVPSDQEADDASEDEDDDDDDGGMLEGFEGAALFAGSLLVILFMMGG